MQFITLERLPPNKEDVKSSIETAKLLFNALHPEHAFGKNKEVILPSSKTIELTIQADPWAAAGKLTKVHKDLRTTVQDFLSERGFFVRDAPAYGVDYVAENYEHIFLVAVLVTDSETYNHLNGVRRVRDSLLVLKSDGYDRKTNAILVTNRPMAETVKHEAKRAGVLTVENGDLSQFRRVLEEMKILK